MMFHKNCLYFVPLVAACVVVAVWVLFSTKNKVTMSCGPLRQTTEVDINAEQTIYTVSDRFLSVSFDNRLLQQHWVHFNFSSSRLFTLGKGLSPAYLRIGGTTEDWLIFQPEQDNNETFVPTSSSAPHFQRDNFTEYNITSADIDKIHLIASKAGWKVLFGLNVCLRTKQGTWDFSNPVKILQYVASKGYDFGWELGNGTLTIY